MQFQVPQFIEVEDKIIGPFTFRQFVYVAGAVGLSFVCWRFLPLLIAAPFIIGIMALGAALAFFKYNDRPFIYMLEHGFYYLTKTKLYLWDTQRKHRTKQKQEQQAPAQSSVNIPKLSNSKLYELSWSLDIKDRVDESAQRDVDQEDMPLQQRAQQTT